MKSKQSVAEGEEEVHQGRPLWLPPWTVGVPPVVGHIGSLGYLVTNLVMNLVIH